MLSYDPITALVLLQDEGAALLIDVSLCVDPKSSGLWIREKKDVVTVIGYLDRSLVGHAVLSLKQFCCTDRILGPANHP